MIYFEDNGRLYLDGLCEMCEKFPLENLNDKCLSCGMSQAEIIQLEENINRANRAIDLMSKFEEDKETDTREAFLHLSGIQLGDGFDQIIFTDIDQTDEIRGLADLCEHMCHVVIYPTNIRHIEGDDWEEDYMEDDM